MARKYKTGFVPSVEDFPYLHNYNAVMGRQGLGINNEPGKIGGHSIFDETTQFDENGVPYKPETEDQRLERFEKYIKRKELLERNLKNQKYGLGEKIKHFIQNKRSRFNWQKLIPGLSMYYDPLINFEGGNTWKINKKVKKSQRLGAFLNKVERFDKKAVDQFNALNKERLKQSKEKIKFNQEWKKNPEKVIEEMVNIGVDKNSSRYQFALKQIEKIKKKIWEKKST